MFDKVLNTPVNMHLFVGKKKIVEGIKKLSNVF